MDKKQQNFFQNVSDSYGDFVKERVSKQELRQRIEPRMGALVLDIGNGGIRDFFSPATKRYIAVDFSLPMLRKGSKKTEKICADAFALPFKQRMFDTIFYRSMLHHLTGEKPDDLDIHVRQALREGYPLLEEKGNIIVVEPCISRRLEKIERVCHFLFKMFFRIIGQPSVFLFSTQHLRKILKESGYGQISETSMTRPRGNRWRLVSPVIGLPRLKVPFALLPVHQVVFEAKKHD